MDMDTRTLTNVLIYAIVGAFVAYFAWKAKEPATPNEHGEVVMKLPAMYLYMGWGSLILGVVFLAPFVIFDSKDMALMGVGLGFVVIGGLLVLAGRNIQTTFTNDSIMGVSWLGKKSALRWEDVQKVGFGTFSLYLTLRGGGKKVRVHLHQVGFGNLIKMVKRKIRPEFTKEALKKLASAESNIARGGGDIDIGDF